VRALPPSSVFSDPGSNHVYVWQEIEIKRAEYGLGAFAVKSISEGQFLGGTSILCHSPPSSAEVSVASFIIEYVGEFVPEEHHARECVSSLQVLNTRRVNLFSRDLRKHIFLNYNFGYNPKFTLDSARVGNETRYINHGSAKEGKANCVARSTLF